MVFNWYIDLKVIKGLNRTILYCPAYLRVLTVLTAFLHIYLYKATKNPFKGLKGL